MRRTVLAGLLLSLPIVGAGMADWFSACALARIGGGWDVELNILMRPVLERCPEIVLALKVVTAFVAGTLMAAYLRRTGRTSPAIVATFAAACAWVAFAAGFQVGQIHIVDAIIAVLGGR